MPSSNTPRLNLSLLIDVTFSTPTPVLNSGSAAKLSGSLSENLHDSKNKPNTNENFANPKQTPIIGISLVRGLMVDVYSQHQSG